MEERFRIFMLALAYDVRKAYEGARERKRIGHQRLDWVKYYSVNILWPYFLPQAALIRHFAAYIPTSHRDQACLYLLEDCAITSLPGNVLHSYLLFGAMAVFGTEAFGVSKRDIALAPPEQ